MASDFGAGTCCNCAGVPIQAGHLIDPQMSRLRLAHAANKFNTCKHLPVQSGSRVVSCRADGGRCSAAAGKLGMSIWWLALLLTNAMYHCMSMATSIVFIKMLCHHTQWQQQSYVQQAAYFPQQQYPAVPSSSASAPPPLPAEPAPPAPAAEAPPPPPLPPPGDPATSQVTFAC
jgi:hypothetical protein